jgi:hypothetical protein
MEESFQLVLLCLIIIIEDFNDYESSTMQEFRYQIQYKNTRAACITNGLLYTIPISRTIGCYIYTLKNIRCVNNMTDLF